MIVYFSANSRNLKEDIGVYREILDRIHAAEASLSHSWVESAWHRVERGETSFHDIRSIVQDTTIGIDSAELVIAEVTGQSAFGVGFEVARAIYLGKPTLLLVRKEKIEDSYATGLVHDLITFKKYDTSNLGRIVEEFIRSNTITTKDLRFNFVLDRPTYNYIRLKSFRTKRTKAEVVRELLKKDMEGGV